MNARTTRGPRTEKGQRVKRREVLTEVRRENACRVWKERERKLLYLLCISNAAERSSARLQGVRSTKPRLNGCGRWRQDQRCGMCRHGGKHSLCNRACSSRNGLCTLPLVEDLLQESFPQASLHAPASAAEGITSPPYGNEIEEEKVRWRAPRLCSHMCLLCRMCLLCKTQLARTSQHSRQLRVSTCEETTM